MKRHSAERYLTIGLLGAAVTVAGQLLGGWAPSTDLTSPLARILSALEGLPIWRLGLCTAIGGLGILLQYFGCYGLYLTFDNLHTHTARLYAAGNCGFTIVGSLVHVLLCVLLFLARLHPGDMALYGRFALWFVLPVFLPFLAGYLVCCITLFLQISRGATLFPRWFCLLNPLTGKLLFNLAQLLLPPTALVNALCFANMGLTSLILFAVFLRQLKISKPARQ